MSKRGEVSTHTHHNAGDATGTHGMNHSTSTTYYATFEFTNGERMELSMSGKDFGLLAEGDEGTLIFQGTRFIGFERSASDKNKTTDD